MTDIVKKKSLNANQLKLIAIAAMTLDHMTWTLFPGYNTQWFVVLFHLIGRLTAPIMWFFIVEGYYHTRNVKKYAARLFLLAVISHFTYNFCFGIPFVPFRTTIFNQTSVIWPLAWGLILLCIHDKSPCRPWQKSLLTILICLITFPADHSCIASMAILYMGCSRGGFKKQMQWMMVWTLFYALVYFFFIDKVYALIQLGNCLTIPLLGLYNGERGSCRKIGKLFYVYYPLHLFLFGILRVLLWGASSATGAANF